MRLAHLENAAPESPGCEITNRLGEQREERKPYLEEKIKRELLSLVLAR